MSEYRQLSDKLHVRESDNQHLYLFWCIGCERVHGLPSRKNPDDGVRPNWYFNGNIENPTFTPSLLHPHKPVCHLFIEEGQIRYLDDCDHKLAGQTVSMIPMEPLE
jgi:hypothetical protein